MILALEEKFFNHRIVHFSYLAVLMLTLSLTFDLELVFIDLRINGAPSGGKELSRPATTPQSRSDAFTANLVGKPPQ